LHPVKITIINQIFIMAKQITDQNQSAKVAEDNTRIPSTEFDDVFTELQSALNILQALITPPLLPSQRRRLQGAGVRRYGLIDKTMDYAQEFKQFVPPTFSLPTLMKAKVHIEVLRDIQILSEQINRLVADGLLIYGNTAFDQTLMYYNSVREQARRNVPGARELFDKLNLLFRPRGRENKIPTVPEVESDVNALLHGRKDGKIVIENEKSHLVGGKHVVVDETHKTKRTFKETEEDERQDI
jgi:hypothetical protein